MTDERRLTASETSLLLRILEGGSFPGADGLVEQIRSTKVPGGIPTLLDLSVDRAAPRADCENGPIPVRAFVDRDEGRLAGEVLVWVKDGYLDGLEFAWVTDEAPTSMPSPEHIRLESA